MSKWMTRTFDFKRAAGHPLAYALNRFRWYNYPRMQYLARFPDHVDIEISSACNMKCPMCYTITDEFKATVKRSLMDFELYKRLIDECAQYGTYSIRLSLRGEPFIHKDIVAMIEYARKQAIKEISTLTNNLALTPELFEKCMKAGLDWLTISFDGLGETYEWIRQPAKFEESYTKIKEYHAIKQRAHSLKPVIKMQTVWPAIKDCAGDYYKAFAPYVDDIAINPLVDYLHNDEEIDYIEDFVCPVLYQRLVIGSDGIALLCSNDEFNMLPAGDANTQSLYDIWHGPVMNRARALHKQHRGFKELEPCKHCFLPRTTQPSIEDIGDRKIVIDKYVNRPDEVGK